MSQFSKEFKSNQPQFDSFISCFYCVGFVIIVVVSAVLGKYLVTEPHPQANSKERYRSLQSRTLDFAKVLKKQ